MSVQIFWPPLAILALIIGIVIMLILRFGGRFLHLRHGTRPAHGRDWSDAAYEQRVSYA